MSFHNIFDLTAAVTLHKIARLSVMHQHGHWFVMGVDGWKDRFKVNNKTYVV